MRSLMPLFNRRHGITKYNNISTSMKMVRNNRDPDTKLEEGECTTMDGDKYKCMIKTYSKTERGHAKFTNSVDIVSAMRYIPQLKELGPDVYDINYMRMDIKMAFISCDTLEKFFQENYIYDESKTGCIKHVLSLLDRMINTFNENNIVHGDLHADNILVRCVKEDMSSSTLKFVDIDSMLQYPEKSDTSPTRLQVCSKGDLVKLASSIVSIVKSTVSVRLEEEEKSAESSLQKRMARIKIKSYKNEVNSLLKDYSIGGKLSSIFMEIADPRFSFTNDFSSCKDIFP